MLIWVVERIIKDASMIRKKNIGPCLKLKKYLTYGKIPDVGKCNSANSRYKKSDYILL